MKLLVALIIIFTASMSFAKEQPLKAKYHVACFSGASLIYNEDANIAEWVGTQVKIQILTTNNKQVLVSGNCIITEK